MGVVIPQVVTEDRASEAQFIDGSLRFDSSKGHKLSRTPGSAGNRTTFTWSGWIKRTKLGAYQRFFNTRNPGVAQEYMRFDNTDTLTISHTSEGGTLTTTQVFRDVSSAYHIVFACDTTISSPSSDRIKVYVNGTRVTTFSGTYPNQNANFLFNSAVLHDIGSGVGTTEHTDGIISNVYFIDGQALTPSSFGYTDPLTNTWRPKTYTGTYGTNGFYLPMDGNTPIGQDRSGNNNNWTPVNFGGSNTLEKATGALPILNTDGGGKVARVGVRTDSNASSLVLALPLVGIRSDFSSRINGATTEKVITASNVSFVSTFSNFYSGSASFNGVNGLAGGSYFSAPASSDWSFGTGDATIEAWAYWDGTYDSGARLIYTNAGSGSNEQLGIDSSVGVVFMGITGGGIAQSFPPVNQWFHIAGTRQNGTVRIFLNGQLVASGTNNSSVGQSGNTLYVGARSDGFHTWKGYIQDFRIYKGLAKYTQNFIPASTDPDILPDTPSGVAYSSNVALVPSTDGAVAFDGVDDYITIANSTDFNYTTSQSFTIEMWLYGMNSGRNFPIGSSAYNSGTGDYSGGIRVDWTPGTNFVFQAGTGFVVGANVTTNTWHHIAYVYDAVAQTSKLYVDGIQSGSTTNGTQSLTNAGNILLGVQGSDLILDYLGYISNFHIVKGTALYTSNFTPPTAPITSVANTKLLCCKSNSSATAADVTPGTITANGNAAATNFNPFTVNINTQRGQESGYATLDPLRYTGTMTFSNGNLNVSGTAVNASSNIAVRSGRWYAEFVYSAIGSTVGLVAVSNKVAADALYGATQTWQLGYTSSGKLENASSQSNTSTFAVGDTVSVAFDCSTGTATFYKNGISVGSVTNSAFANVDVVIGGGAGGANGSDAYAANFGQKPFKFPPPPGFQPLALANTPRPSIVRPDQYVGIVTYTGNGTSQGINIGFKPDLVWIKVRNTTYWNELTDSVRGVGKTLFSNATDAETTTNTLTSFGASGFTVSVQPGYNGTNESPRPYVAWAWKAGGNSNTYNINDVGYATASAAGLTAGTITPTGASVNTKSGFSIITYTGSGSAGTISHGLGNVPSFVVIKKRSDSLYNWNCYHRFIDSSVPQDYFIALNTTDSRQSYTLANLWNRTQPTSSVINLGSHPAVNENTATYVIYCWTEILGFSKFGSYVGNSNADGPVVITGFRPRWVLLKNISDGYDGGGSIINSHSWVIYDTSRNVNNPSGSILAPNKAFAEENNSTDIDFLSNGFKIRTNRSNINPGSTQTVIYAAFAETPSFNLYGGQANAR